MSFIFAWVVGVGLVAGIAFVGLSRYSVSIHFENTVSNQSKKNQLLSQMRIELFKSVEAEKSAVLADTDEDSETFAKESREASDSVERQRAELVKLIEEGKISEEMRLLRQFDDCWSELRKVDRVLLAFAVRNSNLKAGKLSFDEGGKDMQRFEQALDKLSDLSVEKGANPQIPKLVCTALTAALKIHYLHGPHISEASDARMDELEKQMAYLDEVVKNSLDTLSGQVKDPARLALLSSAKDAYGNFEKLTAQVVNLSRENSNIKSFALSVGKKRTVTAQCEDSLTALQEAVAARTFKATR